jgi:hypothetical protein
MQKYKTLLKGVEDSRLLNTLPMKDLVALELVQANCQTYLVFTDRETGDFRGAFYYQREVKSGFIFLSNEGPEEYSPQAETENKKPNEITLSRNAHSLETVFSPELNKQESDLSETPDSIINDGCRGSYSKKHPVDDMPMTDSEPII